ncbi:MAG: hypothetical protein OEW58_09040 [Gammaproteobacteria bacterium]|nr:hypothetical protein [Gammaproteobacteria bacterium]
MSKDSVEINSNNNKKNIAGILLGLFVVLVMAITIINQILSSQAV